MKWVKFFLLFLVFLLLSAAIFQFLMSIFGSTKGLSSTGVQSEMGALGDRYRRYYLIPLSCLISMNICLLFLYKIFKGTSFEKTKKIILRFGFILLVIYYIFYVILWKNLPML